MATAKVQIGASSAAEVKQRREPIVSTSPVRIGQKTKAKLEQLIKQANKDRLGRKIKADDLIGLGLDLITDTQIAKLCDKTRSNKDRMEMLFRKLSKESRGMSRDAFLGMLLDGALSVGGGATDASGSREVKERPA